MYHFRVTLTSDPFKSTFSEHDNVAYQIEGNAIYNNIKAKIFALTHALDPWDEKFKTIFFLKKVMVRISLKGTRLQLMVHHRKHPLLI